MCFFTPKFPGLPKDVIIIVHSTILPVDIEKLEKSLTGKLHLICILNVNDLKASHSYNDIVVNILVGSLVSSYTLLPFVCTSIVTCLVN